MHSVRTVVFARVWFLTVPWDRELRHSVHTMRRRHAFGRGQNRMSGTGDNASACNCNDAKACDCNDASSEDWDHTNAFSYDNTGWAKWIGYQRWRQ